jgi:hypothetical protein
MARCIDGRKKVMDIKADHSERLSHVFLTIDFMDGTESIEATGV